MPRLPSYAATALAVLALAAGCSGGETPDRPRGEASSETVTAPELDGGGGPSEGGAPVFRGRLGVTITGATREVVDEPCTGNQIERLCGSSARFDLRRQGPAERVTLTGATTTTEPSGLSWRVRLEFAAAAPPLPRPSRGAVQVLATADGLEVEIGPDARVGRSSVVLPGLDKRNAWALVDSLDGSA